MDNHPLADAFPLMSEAEFEGLKQDIKEHGVRHPVVVFEGMILDGRNRKRACQELGKACPEIKFTGENPAAYVASENIHRRHMEPRALVLAAERLATAMAGRPKKSPAGPDGPADHPTTIREAAELTGASPTSIKKVRTVRNRGADEVVAAMDKGELTPTAADNLSKRPKEEQSRIMATVPVKDIPTVAASTLPAEEALAMNPGRGQVGPKVMLERQMSLPDLTMVQKVVLDWAEHKGVITELPPAKLATFVRELRKSRTATTRLLELIDLETKADSAPSPRSNGATKGADAPTTPPAKAPVKRAAKAPAKAAKTPATPAKTTTKEA